MEGLGSSDAHSECGENSGCTWLRDMPSQARWRCSAPGPATLTLTRFCYSPKEGKTNGNVSWYSHCGKHGISSKKQEIKSIRPSSPTPGHISDKTVIHAQMPRPDKPKTLAVGPRHQYVFRGIKQGFKT